MSGSVLRTLKLEINILRCSNLNFILCTKIFVSSFLYFTIEKGFFTIEKGFLTLQKQWQILLCVYSNGKFHFGFYIGFYN